MVISLFNIIKEDLPTSSVCNNEGNYIDGKQQISAFCMQK